MSEKKLSHSACGKYMQCPASYDYHYNQRIRPITLPGYLEFGQRMDAALNALLLTRSGKEAMNAYDAWVVDQEITYSVNDVDRDLLDYGGNDVGEDLTSMARESFRQKARLMIKAYIKQVLPNIKEVYGVQVPTGPGFLDALVEWEGVGKIIVDHKTAGRPYPDNAVEYSAQLAMYAAEAGVSKVAFVVMNKQVKKNREKECTDCKFDGSGRRHKTCPECGGAWVETIRPEVEIQVIHGEVSERMKEVSAELQREVQRAVDAKIFPCNVNACNSQYGKPCIYRDLKWKNDMTNLRKVEK